MRMLTKALLAIVAGAFVSASGANAATKAWNCTAPANVCAKKYSKHGTAKHATKKSYKKHYAKSSHKKKSHNVAHKSHKKTMKAASYGGGQSGVASWYGGKFHGRKTANG
ncbi:MAG: hypothetical protein KDJ17_08895, partial [Hyphomicrobiaceae bacterium]|nr:hypothetical protein [Hyphomicrobiaceae bacterium]